MAKKGTDAQVKERVYTVYSMLLDSYDRPTILRYGVKEWGVTERGVDCYITEANKWIDNAYKEKRYQKMYRSIARRYRLKTLAKKKGDLNLAHEIQKDIDRLEGLYPSTKHSIEGKMTLTDFLRKEKILPEGDDAGEG